MRYENNGIEIQYRECQIIREAAKKTLLEDMEFDEDILVQKKDRFLFLIRKIGREKKLKRGYCDQISRFLKHMEKSYFEAFIRYVRYLTVSERGIELMKPFFLENGKVVMPVNKHEKRVGCNLNI